MSASEPRDEDSMVDVGMVIHGHPRKACEDTYLMKGGDAGGIVIGVLDGVGGSRIKGSPMSVARYVEALSANVVAALELPCWECEQLRTAVRDGAAKTQLPGASTACVVALGPDYRSASALNLGDSGFVLLRGGADARIVLASTTQQHYWNCPVQIEGGAWCGEEVLRSAEAINFDVEPGDLIVLGSDGLWDNLYFHDLAAIVRSQFAAAEAEAAAAAAAVAIARRRDPAARAQGGGNAEEVSAARAGADLGALDAGATEPSADGPGAAETRPQGPSDGGCADASSCESGCTALGRSSSNSSSLSSGSGGGGLGAAAAGPAWPAAQGVAEALAMAAKINSTDPQFVSPFGLVDRAIRRHEKSVTSGNLLQAIGSGKVDDITCLAVLVPHAPQGAATASCAAGAVGAGAVGALGGATTWAPDGGGDEAAGSSTAPACATGEQARLAPPLWRQPGVLTWDKLVRCSAAGKPGEQEQRAAEGGEGAEDAEETQWCGEPSASAAAAAEVGSDWGCGWGDTEAQWAAEGWAAAQEQLQWGDGGQGGWGQGDGQAQADGWSRGGWQDERPPGAWTAPETSGQGGAEGGQAEAQPNVGQEARPAQEHKQEQEFGLQCQLQQLGQTALPSGNGYQEWQEACVDEGLNVAAEAGQAPGPEQTEEQLQQQQQHQEGQQQQQHKEQQADQQQQQQERQQADQQQPEAQQTEQQQQEGQQDAQPRQKEQQQEEQHQKQQHLAGEDVESAGGHSLNHRSGLEASSGRKGQVPASHGTGAFQVPSGGKECTYNSSGGCSVPASCLVGSEGSQGGPEQQGESVAGAADGSGSISAAEEIASLRLQVASLTHQLNACRRQAEHAGAAVAAMAAAATTAALGVSPCKAAAP